MHTRDISTSQCVAYVVRADKAKVPVDWNTSVSVLAGSEVHVHVFVYIITNRNMHMHMYINVILLV